nr:rhamnan synthesis F family protein [Pseudoclavibacter alba]
MTVTAAVRRPRGNPVQRHLVYFSYDPDARVDAASRHLLDALREHIQHLAIVVNGTLDEESHAWASERADVVLERENEGFDVGAYRYAIDALRDTHADADELILANFTSFGPVGDLGEIFDRAALTDVDIWGLTAHGPLTPNPYTHRGVMPEHLQSHFLAVRRRVLESAAWREYWQAMPEITSYSDSIQLHEARFTPWMRARGFSVAALWERPLRAGEQSPAANATIERPLELLEAGYPLVKRRLAWHEPLELDHRGSLAAETFTAMAERGYPMELVLDAVRGASPRAVATNLGWQLATEQTPAGVLEATPWAGVVFPTDLRPGRDLRADADDAAAMARTAAEFLGLTDSLTLDTNPLRPHPAALAVRPELMADLDAHLERAGGLDHMAATLGWSAARCEEALALLLAPLALRQGFATLEIAPASAWAHAAQRAATREQALRDALPRGIRMPFAEAQARARGALSPQRAAVALERTAPELARRAKAIIHNIRTTR